MRLPLCLLVSLFLSSVVASSFATQTLAAELNNVRLHRREGFYTDTSVAVRIPRKLSKRQFCARDWQDACRKLSRREEPGAYVATCRPATKRHIVLADCSKQLWNGTTIDLVARVAAKLSAPLLVAPAGEPEHRDATRRKERL